METKPLRQFDDLQQEEMSCEQLEKVLKYQMRSASFVLGALAITQTIYLTINPEIFLQNDRYACTFQQIVIFILGLYGVYFSFGQLDKVVKTQSTYYKEKDTKVLVPVMIANIIMAAVLAAYCFYASTSALANRSLQIAQNTAILTTIFPQYITLFDSKELATFTLLSVVQLICFAYMCHIYWLFCDTSEVEQFLCEFLSFLVLIVLLFLLSNTHNALRLKDIDLPVDKDQLQPLFAGGIFVGICLIFVLLQRNLHFIDTFKSQIWRFTMGVVLMVCAYVIVSLNGLISRQYVENIGIFTEQCARYIDLAQEDSLIAAGCPYKYYESQFNAQYPQNPQNTTCMQLFEWEAWPKQQFQCVNTNCCQFLNNYFMDSVKNVILLSYITITLLTMLIGVLFHIRRTEVDSPNSKIKIGFLSIILVLLISLYLFGETYLPSHRPVLSNRKNNPEVYTFKAQHQTQFDRQYQTNFEAFGCNPMTIDSKLQDLLLKTNNVQLNLTLDQGTFLVLDYNQPNIIFYFGCQTNQQANDCLSIAGNGSQVLQSLQSVKLCLTSVEPQLQWKTNSSRRILQATVTQQKPNQQNQDILSKYLSFINVTVQAKANHEVDLYNSLILDCSYNIEQVPYFMHQRTNESGVAIFYNYPAGAYGTTVAHDKVAVCDVFQTYHNINLQPLFPGLKILTFFAIWDIEVDMDLMVFFKFEDRFCLVGSKASKECGYVWAGTDSTKSQTAETISFHSMGQYDYVVFVRSPSFKGSLTVQVYLEEHVYPINTIHVDQAQEQSDVWVAACINRGKILNIKNQYYFDGVIPNLFCN